MHSRPFEDKEKILIILPTNFEGLDKEEIQQLKDIKNLFEEHRLPLERELGARLEFDKNNLNCSYGSWFVGPFDSNPSLKKLGIKRPSGPQIFLDRKKSILVTDGCNPGEVNETYSYLRSLNKLNTKLFEIKNCETNLEAIDRVKNEISTSYPSLQLRGLDWSKICDHYIPIIKKSDSLIEDLQCWTATLNDAHTWVRPTSANAELPYELFVKEGRGWFSKVAKNTAAWKLGIRPGCELLDRDYLGWWKRTAASWDSKPYVVGKRILSSEKEISQKLKAKLPDGNIIEWEETPVLNRWDPVVSSSLLPSGNGYLLIKAWLLGKSMEEKIDEAFDKLKNCPKLIVDLRSNPGGNFLMAQSFRNRFLKDEELLGYIQNTLPNGSLSKKESINGVVLDRSKQWDKPVVFLTNALTYSASEDAILGLQGLSHVRIVGQQSGGGSGRVRQLRLLPGYKLTISTALTFDRNGYCIENNGVPVDHQIKTMLNDDHDKVLKFADEL